MHKLKLLFAAVCISLLGISAWAAQAERAYPNAPTPEEYAEAEANWVTLDSLTNDDEEACVGNNLAFNPSFEGAYSSYVPPNGHPDCIWGPCNSAQMADGWTPFWRSHDNSDPGWIYIMPEWKPATADFTNPPRVVDGGRAQQWFTFFATHDAGIYQQINGTTPGADYCLSVQGHAWSSHDDQPYTDPSNHGFLNQWIGIDPTGGTDYLSPNIIWTPKVTQYDEYGLFKLSAQAQASSMTVFLRAEPLFAAKHNDVYWDDLRFTQVSTLQPPVMTIGPTFFEFSADIDTPINETRTVTVNLANPNGLTWFASVNPDSQFTPTLSRSGGSAGDTTFDITVNSSGLPVGTHLAFVDVYASDPSIEGGSQQVVLRIDVSEAGPEPEMVVEDTWFEFIAEENSGETFDAHIDISMQNADGLTWNATVTSESTFTPELNQTTGTPGEDLDLTIDTDGLSAGVYNAYLLIEASDPSIDGGSWNVTIRLEITEEVLPPTIVTESAEFNFWSDVDHPLAFSDGMVIDLANASGASWIATVNGSSDFVPTLTSAAGEDGDQIAFEFDPAGLVAGTYVATVEVVIDSAEFESTPTTITINLDVRDDLFRIYLPLIEK